MNFFGMYFRKVVDGVRGVYIMRTSSAAPGFFGGVEESGEARNFAEMLDGRRGLLHNLASLLLTDLLKRRGD
jgi:hypothetical protein